MTFELDSLSALITRVIDEELDKLQGVIVSFKVPTKVPPRDLNVEEEIVGTSTTANSGMEHCIEQDNNEIGDETNDDILLEGEEEITELLIVTKCTTQLSYYNTL